MPEVATPNQGEREFETGSDEFFKAHSELTAANAKRTYDAYQDLDLLLARRSQLQFDQIHNVALQALQNAVETANMVAKQTVRHIENADETANVTGKQANRHSDIAIDQQWNPVQQGAGDTLTARSVSIDDASLKAIGAMIAQAMAAMMPAQVATGGAPAAK